MFVPAPKRTLLVGNLPQEQIPTAEFAHPG